MLNQEQDKHLKTQTLISDNKNLILSDNGKSTFLIGDL